MTRIALYMRLSKGDDPGEESDSIRLQRILLKEFAAAHFTDYELLEFADDGYSGKNFDRPGIAGLLRMARAGEVDCIIVKDFSRFSRDYIELGSYMEQIFPVMGVRFISVNDGYDSAGGELSESGLDISFKNLLYDLYSRDLSMKVKSSLAVRKAAGQYISARSPFGYEKFPEDRHKLCIVEEEAEVVRRIFRLTLQGYTSVQIARQFNEEGVKTPAQFRIEKGQPGSVPRNGLFVWQPAAVCRILQNEVYAGDIVYGKTEKDAVGGRNHLKPKSQWRIYRDHHEAIIDRSVFELAQEGRGRKKAKSVSEPHPLSGSLVCAYCGRNLCIRDGAKPYFTCANRYVIPRNHCLKQVDAAWLERRVLSELQTHVCRTAGEGRMKARYRQALSEELFEWKRNKRRKTGRAAPWIPEEKIRSLEEALGRETGLEEVFDYFGLSRLTRRNVSGLIREIAVYDGDKYEISWREDGVWQLCNTGGDQLSSPGISEC